MNEHSDTIQTVGKDLKWLGILTLVLGVLALFTPLMTGISVVVFVGLFVMGGGAARMFWAFKSPSFGRGLLKFAVGGLTLLCGLVMVTDPVVGSGVLTVVIAVYLLVDGGFEIAAAFTAPPAGGKGWMLFGGIVSILLGLMIWKQYPLSGSWAVGIMLGVKLVTVGLGMLGIGRVARKVS